MFGTNFTVNTKAKPFLCPHCGRVTIAHYHQKDGPDVACLSCVRKTVDDYISDRAATDPKYFADDKEHATWRDGPWPFLTVTVRVIPVEGGAS